MRLFFGNGIRLNMAKTAFVAFLLVLCVLARNLEAQDAPAGSPPRFEIGAIVSDGKQTPDDVGQGGLNYHVGGGGRVTVNAHPNIAGEIELTRQPTGGFGYGPETHIALALKATYRAEQRRWLGFAGVNFFGVIGPGFLRRTVTVDNPNPPPMCFRCSVQERVTTAMVDFGGGAEIVPARNVAIRFDVTHASFDEMLFLSNGPTPDSRTYIKVAVMLRFP
jgi:hypothetical protein